MDGIHEQLVTAAQEVARLAQAIEPNQFVPAGEPDQRKIAAVTITGTVSVGGNSSLLF